MQELWSGPLVLHSVWDCLKDSILRIHDVECLMIRVHLFHRTNNIEHHRLRFLLHSVDNRRPILKQVELKTFDMQELYHRSVGLSCYHLPEEWYQRKSFPSSLLLRYRSALQAYHYQISRRLLAWWLGSVQNIDFLYSLGTLFSLLSVCTLMKEKISQQFPREFYLLINSIAMSVCYMVLNISENLWLRDFIFWTGSQQCKQK